MSAQAKPPANLVDRIDVAADALHRQETEPGMAAGRWMLPLIELELGFCRERAKLFDKILFGDPAWEMILVLARARLAGERKVLSEICSDCDIPFTTAVREISKLIEHGIAERNEGGRRLMVSLTYTGLDLLARSFDPGAADG